MTATLDLGRNPAARLRAARWATRAQFFALGFSAGIWGVHIPSAKAHYGLSAAGLSVALLAFAVGAVVCLTLAGRLVSALGARMVALLAGLVMCTSLALIFLGATFVALKIGRASCRERG